MHGRLRRGEHPASGEGFPRPGVGFNPNPRTSLWGTRREVPCKRVLTHRLAGLSKTWKLRGRLRRGEHPAAGEGLWGTRREVPSFLYAMPLGGARVFLEETCLVAKPALPFAVLKRRLRRRLAAMGLKARAARGLAAAQPSALGSFADAHKRTLPCLQPCLFASAC